MIICERYHSGLKQEWNELVAKAKSQLFFFDRSFMEYHKHRFEDASLLFREGSECLAILPASLHESTLVSHGGLTYGGLLLSDNAKSSAVLEIFSVLINYCKEHNITAVIYKAIPYIFFKKPSQEDLYALYRNSATLIKRELSSAIDLSVRPKLSKGRKWLINKAKKADVVVLESNKWVDFYVLLSQVLSKHNAKPVHNSSEMEYLNSLFPSNVVLKTAQIGEEILAATLLFKFQDVTHTQYIVTSEHGKLVGALDFLLESCIEEAQLSGQQYFSFGISTEDGGLILNTGLVAQKEGFGARGVILDTYQLNIADVET